MTPFSYSFPLLDLAGKRVPSKGWGGHFGLSDRYRGTTKDTDELMLALHSAVEEAESLTDRQIQLIYSLTESWLNGRQKKLGQVVACSVQLPSSVYYLSRVGILDRTAEVVVGGTALAVNLVGSFLLWDAVWELVPSDELVSDPFAATAIGTAFSILPDIVLGEVKNQLGDFGTPIARKNASPDCLFNFLQLCQLRKILTLHSNRLGDESKLQSVVTRLDQRSFAMFVAISRQFEGLMRSGESGALAAAGFQSGLVLGLKQVSTSHQILVSIRTAIKTVKDKEAAAAVEAMLDSVEAAMALDTSQVQRELDRQLASSMVSEASGIAAEPLRLTLRFLGDVTGMLTYVAPNPGSVKMVKTVQHGFQHSSTLVEATPDALSRLFRGAISSESWARNLFNFSSKEKQPKPKGTNP